MIKILFILFFSQLAFGYIPTVESLFRHGGNPEVLVNGVSLSFSVTKYEQDEQGQFLINENSKKEFFRLFLNKNGELLKTCQVAYSGPNYSDSSVLKKTCLSNLNDYMFNKDLGSVDKKIFLGSIFSISFNSGLNLLNYLKNIGVPIRLNNEIINREMIELLASYKRYLLNINKDRNARKTEINPLNPTDPLSRERVQQILSQSMYSDTRQVKLKKDGGEIFWHVEAEGFESLFSYMERDLKEIKYKSTNGTLEIQFNEYWRANGSHLFPRFIRIKTTHDQLYQVEILGMRHYSESEDDFYKRIRFWENILKGKRFTEASPEFLL
jgi:hypothetical protein